MNVDGLVPEVRNLIPVERRPRADEVLAGPIVFDAYGLVIPTKRPHEFRGRVVSSLTEARNRMQTVMLDGKTVIYFPGAFDLVHFGHVSYILQGIRQVLETCKLTRDQLFVVVLADSDDLIAAVKPAHEYASNGEHPRPIESRDVFNSALSPLTINPRLIDLAQLDVDMVGLLPSPDEAFELLESWDFKYWFERHGKFQNSAVRMLLNSEDEAASEARATVEEYLRLADAIERGEYERIIGTFDAVKHNLPIVDDVACWSLPSWQLLLHRFLGIVSKKPEAGCYRILSKRDKYSKIVERLMDLSNIATALVDDTHLLSTTALLGACSSTSLYKAKYRAFKNWVSR